MQNNTAYVKNILMALIDKMSHNTSSFVKNPGKDFTRNRKLSFRKMLLMLISMGGNTIHKELFNFHKFDPNAATSAAFVQQRAKFLPSAFEYLFHEFTGSFPDSKKFNGYRLLAVDGSDLHIPTNENDADTYFKSSKDARGYNLLHLNVLFDLCNKRYESVFIQPRRHGNEHKALLSMIDRSDISGKVIVVADRGYESYNDIAQIGEKGWNYVIRVKDKDSNGIISKLKLSDSDEFDITASFSLTRKQTNEIKLNPDKYRLLPSHVTFDCLEQGSSESYPMSFRVVRLKIDDNSYETLVTNLSESEFPPEVLGEIYEMRWGIETSFRELKYSIGLLSFHSKKVEYILQEIYAKVIAYNFSMIIVMSITLPTRDRKYEYQANFVLAVHICVYFLRYDDVSPHDVEVFIMKNILPIRKGRKSKRRLRNKSAISFVYRIA